MKYRVYKHYSRDLIIIQEYQYDWFSGHYLLSLNVSYPITSYSLEYPTGAAVATA
jgi:hypothetical protein